MLTRSFLRNLKEWVPWNDYVVKSVAVADGAPQQSPNGCPVKTAASDETLRCWNVFGVPKVATRAASKANPEPFSQINRSPTIAICSEVGAIFLENLMWVEEDKQSNISEFLIDSVDLVNEG